MLLLAFVLIMTEIWGDRWGFQKGSGAMLDILMFLRSNIKFWIRFYIKW